MLSSEEARSNVRGESVSKHVDKSFRKVWQVNLGPRYQEVVEKCITWDEDDDLPSDAVQEGFCDKVVCELDICLAKFDDQ